MSSIRALSLELPQRSDASLRELFAARPDLISPPVPDFAALAARACARISVHRALDSLDTAHLHAVEVALLGTGPLDAKGLQQATGGSKAAAERILRRLNTLALCYKSPGGFLPVSSLHEVIGAHPAGLGRSYLDLADAVGERLQSAADRLGLGGRNPGQALAERFQRTGWWEQTLASAPEHTAALLAKFDDGPVGALPKTRRSRDPEGPPGPVDFLLEQAILVPLDNEHVELPREAGLALRGGRIFPDSPEPPVSEAAPVDPARRDNAALGAVAELLRQTGLLLEHLGTEPLPTLRTGGIGVRALRPLAAGLQIEPARLAFLLELAAAAGLIQLDVDTSAWTVPAAWSAPMPQTGAVGSGGPTGLTGLPGLTDWDRLPRAEQWQLLGAAWLGSDRVPGLIGQSAPAGGTINPLAAEARRADAPVLRRLLLELLGRYPGAAPEQDRLFALARWQRPRLWRRLGRLAPGIIQELEILGLTGSGALTEFGNLLILDGPAAAARLAEALPAPVSKVFLQADLTAVAPGFLEPGLALELALLADREGQGPAATYRFSAPSLRRALDAGQGPEQIVDFLREHSSTSIPQPLEYLIRDTAARHGRLQVGSASSVITGADEVLLASLLHDPALSRLGLRLLAPGVLASQASPSELAQALRAAGHAPAVERSEPPYRSARAGNPDVEPEPAATTEAETTAQLSLLRSRPIGIPVNSAVVPQLSIETLREAIRVRRAVRLTMVDAAGNPERLLLVPLSVANGRLRVFDPARDTERIMSIHRIVDVDIVAETDSAPAAAANDRIYVAERHRLETHD